MAVAEHMKGEKDYMEIELGASGSGSWGFLCMVDSVDDQVQVNEEEVYKNDCADPDALPVRETSVTGKSYSKTISGFMAIKDASYQQLRAKIGLPWRFKHHYKTGTGEGGYIETLTAIPSNFQQSKANNGIVRFSATLSVQGAPSEAAI